MLAIAPVALLVLLAQPARPPYWGDLRPGPHPVGFTQRWVIDSTRRLPGGERFGLTRRPILLNLWYPATRPAPKPMRYDDYFAGAIRAAGRNRGLARYATELIAYQRGVVWLEVAGTERDSTPPEFRRWLDQMFAGPTVAGRDLPRATGARPIVVYASGARSSMDDNVVLCEFLASRGYLVVGSAFPEEDGSSYATNATDQSRQRDIGRLLLELARLTGSPAPHVTAIGHSAGAQALQILAADPSAPIDALISLDTTEDYATLTDRAWASFTDRMIQRRREVVTPIAFVAGPEALFELADSLAASRRWLVTVPDLDHNDFISQGITRHRLRAGLPDGDSARRERATRGNLALMEWVAGWIDSQAGRSTGPVPSRPLVTVIEVPPGTRSPDPVAEPPRTAREVRHLVTTATPDRFAALVVAARQADSAIAGTQVLMMILADLVRKGEADRARLIYDQLIAGDSTVKQIPARMASRAKLFESIGATAEALEWRRLLRPFEGTPP